MNCLIIGAGNAGRPVARFLNYKGNNVVVTDAKKLSDFRYNNQNKIKELEDEGVTVLMQTNDYPLDDIDLVYMPPTLPSTAPIAQKIAELGIEVLTNDDFSKMVNDEISGDIIGITGTMGKTTTTILIASLFRQAGYKIWLCSSLANNLVSETIIDGIVRGEAQKCDIAILELPHGSLGLLRGLNIKIGILTILAEDHLNEFEGSLEKYHDRKMFLSKMSKTFVTNDSCRYRVQKDRDDAIYYSLDNPADFNGVVGDESLTVKYSKGEFTAPFHMMSYFFENALGASAVALSYGISEKDIIEALDNFKGLPAHMEDVGTYNGRKVIIDAAFLEEGMKSTLEYFKDDYLVLFLDHFDTSAVRDKTEVGKLVAEYANVVVASGYNESISALDMDGANEILEAIDDPDIIKVAAKDLDEAAELCFKYSKPGDIILHIGPLISYDLDNIVDKIMTGVKRGSQLYD